MEKKSGYYFLVDKQVIQRFNGDLALAVWYSALLSYSKRFKKDRFGYFRISRQTIVDDLNLSHQQVRTLNAKLAREGLVEIDSANHGGRTFAGYRLLHKPRKKVL